MNTILFTHESQDIAAFIAGVGSGKRITTSQQAMLILADDESVDKAWLACFGGWTVNANKPFMERLEIFVKNLEAVADVRKYRTIDDEEQQQLQEKKERDILAAVAGVLFLEGAEYLVKVVQDPKILDKLFTK